MNTRLAAAVLLYCTWLGIHLIVAPQGAQALFAAAEPADLPHRLADTGLYADGTVGSIDPRNRLFVPQYPLWSDGLKKRRWIYLPPGTTINGGDEYSWEFPVGTKFWKEFSFAGRRIETRLLWKTADAEWVPASYLWNEGGSDAVLAPEGGVPAVFEVAPGRWLSIPSRSDCTACHGRKPTSPLGFTALQLSPDRDPNAVHGEQLAPEALTLASLMEAGLLRHARGDLAAKPPRIRTSTPAGRAVLGYLATNCGMCHNGTGEIAAMAPVLRGRELVENGDAVLRSFLDQRTRWQFTEAAEGQTVLVNSGAPERSALLARMRSRSPSSQMPPLGTVIRDQAAVDLVTSWIATEVPALPPATHPKH